MGNDMIFRKIEFHYITVLDAGLLFQWQSHPKTRQYFRDPKTPTLEEHTHWLQQKLADKNCVLLLAYDNEMAVGCLRFDFSNVETEVSIYLAPDLYGQGYGSNILSKGIEWIQLYHPEIRILKAAVVEENKASVKIFTKNGFIQNETMEGNSLVLIRNI